MWICSPPEPLFQLRTKATECWIVLLGWPGSNLHSCLAWSWDLFLAVPSLLLPWLIQETQIQETQIQEFQIQETQDSTAEPEENKSVLPLSHDFLPPAWLEVECSGVSLLSVLCLRQKQT